jgi:hypothetical protein
VPRELLSAIKATGKEERGLASLPIAKARGPEEALEEEIAIIKEGQRAASSARGDREGDPASPAKCEAKFPASIRGEWTERNGESLLKEAQLCRKSSQARELRAYGAQV